MEKFLERIKCFIIGIAVFFLYYKILPKGLMYIVGLLVDNPNKIVSNIVMSIVEIIIFLVLFLIFRKKIVTDFKNFKKDYKKNLDIGFKYYFIGFLVMAVSNIILSFLTGGIAENEALNREYLKLYPLYSVVAMVFVGPLVEEIVFRLGFRKCFNKWLQYAIFSGLLFGSLHVYTAYEGMKFAEILKNWHEMLYVVPYGALGFAFAKAFYETDNIWTTMTMHVLHNAFTVLLIFCTM